MKNDPLVFLDYVISSIIPRFIILLQCHIHLLSILVVLSSPTAQVVLGNFDIETRQFFNSYSYTWKMDVSLGT